LFVGRQPLGDQDGVDPSHFKRKEEQEQGIQAEKQRRNRWCKVTWGRYEEEQREKESQQSLTIENEK